MSDPGRLVPSASVAGVRLVAVAEPGGRDRAEIRRLHDLVAGPHRRPSVGWSNDQWDDFLGDPARGHRFIDHDGDRVGWACFRRHRAPRGRDRVVRTRPAERWAEVSGDMPIWAGVDRSEARAAVGPAPLWLTTDSWDHPHATINYRPRGLTEYSLSR